MENSNDTIKIISSALIGVAIGGALGILFAPYKGKKTRKKILNKGEDLAEIIKDQFSELMEQVSANQKEITENLQK
ncbi:MAG: YtxH domain-containing protein [Flavobacteriales bacterium]|nr:MAG: YtxH domain-containing protein [Flavobacteriales bacterium]